MAGEREREENKLTCPSRRVGFLGTPLPRHLFLVYEDLEQFHLLAREAKPVSGMNSLLVTLGDGLEAYANADSIL